MTDVVSEHGQRLRRYLVTQTVAFAAMLLGVWAGTTPRASLLGFPPLWVSAGAFVVFVAGVGWSMNDYRCPACRARLMASARRVRQTGQCPACGVALR